MAEPATDFLIRAPLRAVAGFRFVPIAAVSALDRASLPDAGAQSGWAGALTPEQPGWRRAHLITQETVELLDSLRHAAPIPAGSDPAGMARLVLDGIVEVEHAGEFRSGPAAHSLFFPSEAPPPSGPLGRLSLEALQYAMVLGTVQPLVLAQALYRYNTLPASPQWRRRLPDARAVARLLDAGRLQGKRRGRSAWTRWVSADKGPVWEVWERRRAVLPPPGAPTYKLYVTPPVAAIAEARAAVLALAGTPGAPFALKLGGDLLTLLRSEKLVAYYTTLAELREGAARLRSALAGLPGQGVPFTAELGAGRLLSWGADPGDLAEPPGPLRQTSWRRWITARLATALATALAADSPVPAWQYALDRVSLDGVDPLGWTPPAWFWNGFESHAHH